MKFSKRILLSSALVLGCAEVDANAGILASTTAAAVVPTSPQALSDGSAWVVTAANDTLAQFDHVTASSTATIYAGDTCTITTALNLGDSTVTKIRGVDGKLTVTALDPGSAGNNTVEFYNSFTVSGFGGGTSKTTYVPKVTAKILTGGAVAMSQNLHVENATTLATFTSLTGKVTGHNPLTLGASVVSVSGDMKNFSGSLVTGAAITSLTSNLPHATLSMGHAVTYGASVGTERATINSLSATASVTLDTASLSRTPVVFNKVAASGAARTLTITAAEGQHIYIKDSGSGTDVLSLVFTGSLGTLHLPRSWRRSLPANLAITTAPARTKYDIVG